MRNRDNRYKVNKLFVLGAGASFAASRQLKSSPELPREQSPLDKNFLKEIKDKYEKANRPGWTKEAFSKVNRAWHNPRELTDAGLEEAIITQEGDYLVYRDIQNSSGPQRVPFSDFLENLIFLISHRLYRCHEKRNSSWALYTELVNRFFNRRSKNRIISFNYDIMLDEALKTKRGGWQGIYPKKILENSCNTTRIEYPLLLKLHGSINWRIDKVDFGKLINGNISEDDYEKLKQVIGYKNENLTNFAAEKNRIRLDKIERKDGRIRDPRKNNSLPCIIPPIQSKPIVHIEQFRMMWDLASEYLSMCKELYIIGYSLPETDALAGALFRSIQNNNLKKITIIDPDVETLGKWHKMLNNPNLTNGKKKTEFHYLSGFADLF